MQVRIGKHHTNGIHCEKGVKQGCPLSPILLDLKLEQLIHSVNKEGYNFTQGEVAVLAYAGDLCFIADTPNHLQEMLDWAQEFAIWTGLQFKASKCTTSSINCAPRHFVENNHFHIRVMGCPL